jgi:hypothetical protein
VFDYPELCEMIIRHICTTAEFLTYSITWYFYANKIIFCPCPHTLYFEPITFRKKQYKTRKCSHVILLVKGNTSANAFSVKISRDEPISELKDAIKAKKAPEFDNFPADKLKLWNVKIPGDHLDESQAQ